MAPLSTGMAPVTAKMLSNLEEAIDQIPNQDRNQTPRQFRKRAGLRLLFRKLLVKLAGEDKDEQVAFMVHQARKVSSKTYIKAVLESIPNQPDYVTLDKKNRPTYFPVRSLLDEILPIAAGTENIPSQKKLFENRWEFMHKEPYVPTTMTVRFIRKVIEAKFNSIDEQIDFYLSQAR